MWTRESGRFYYMKRILGLLAALYAVGQEGESSLAMFDTALQDCFTELLLYQATMIRSRRIGEPGFEASRVSSRDCSQFWKKLLIEVPLSISKNIEQSTIELESLSMSKGSFETMVGLLWSKFVSVSEFS